MRFLKYKHYCVCHYKYSSYLYKLCTNVDIFFEATGIKNPFFLFQSQFLFFVSFRRCNMRKVEYTSMTTKTENMTIHVPAVT